MRKFLSILAISFFALANSIGATTLDIKHLDKKQQGIITIAAFTASGNIEKLNVALNEGLDAGLTINEIKEVLIQMYAYSGFPRSLNGINAFKVVLDDRQSKGIKDEVGREASPISSDINKDEYGARVRADLIGSKTIPAPSGYQLFVPTIDTFLKEHLFTDIFARDILDYKTRELSTISALASLRGTAAQLRSHLNISMNVGFTKEALEDFVKVIEINVGEQEAKIAKETLDGVLNSRK
ncbi:MAG: carboxymuconolactone decarboxylase family protein [Campylobacteraceae bacterium]